MSKQFQPRKLSRQALETIDRKFTAVLTIWFISVLLSAWFGLYEQLSPSTLVIPIFAGIAIPLAIYFRSNAFQQYIRSIPLKHLTLFHLWRIPAGVSFLFYGSQGWLPETFARNAGWGDLAVGVLVPLVLMVPGGRGKYAAFHIFGILDFIVALGTGIIFALTLVPTMENIAQLPIVLIPMFGVAVTGSLSVMTLHRIGVEYVEESVSKESAKTPMAEPAARHDSNEPNATTAYNGA